MLLEERNNMKAKLRAIPETTREPQQSSSNMKVQPKDQK